MSFWTGLGLKTVGLTQNVCCRKDRVTVQEREAEALKQKELEQEAKRMAEERRKYTLKVRGETSMFLGGWKGKCTVSGNSQC